MREVGQDSGYRVCARATDERASEREGEAAIEPVPRRVPPLLPPVSPSMPPASSSGAGGTDQQQRRPEACNVTSRLKLPPGVGTPSRTLPTRWVGLRSVPFLLLVLLRLHAFTRSHTLMPRWAAARAKGGHALLSVRCNCSSYEQDTGSSSLGSRM